MDIIVINENNLDIDSIVHKIELPLDLVGSLKELKKSNQSYEAKVILIDDADNQEMNSFILECSQLEIVIIRVTDYHIFLENNKGIQKKIHCIYNGNETIYLAFKK